MSTDLHTRLLAEVNRRSWLVADNEQAQMAEAVVAVVELHAPETLTYPTNAIQCGYCDSLCHSRSGLGCESPDAPWPCSTIRVIAEQLGVPIDKSITEKEERRD